MYTIVYAKYSVMRQSRFVIAVRLVKQEASCESLLTATNAPYRSLYQEHLGMTILGVKNVRSKWAINGKPGKPKVSCRRKAMLADDE